ncbi:formin-like 2 domain protein [Gregarina niphandrodes]|uniref:Formin-like 2 domain protein n=1 Tax=Gregarina niphandrodes TaxID=110365 RepID=A0A023B2U8_GRENI|nr:formin-like 2 domain protein [Gregarina niphandrodes]EZG55224.1 formin-like 2 domain protein [Gregarina niphandrodes]|eukprot:XP_011131705.1 formin-like 2 domain protein [Gregarina niphandrodes]
MIGRKNTVALKTVKRVRKLLWSPITEPDAKSLWLLSDRGMDYDRDLIREMYVKILTTKSIKKHQASDKTLDQDIIQDIIILPSILDPKLYQRLVVCLKGLRLTDLKIELILDQYNKLYMNTKFGQLSTISSPTIPQYDELRLIYEALPDFSVTNFYQQKVYNQQHVKHKVDKYKLECQNITDENVYKTITDWLDYRLMDIETKYPYLRFNLNIILKRYEVESTLARICTRLLELYHCILTFDECYHDNIVPLLHTIRSIGNVLNEGTYLGNAKGFNLSSLKLFLSHKSVDKEHNLTTELRKIVNRSGINYEPLFRFYTRIRNFDNMDEIYNDYRELNSTINTTTPLIITKQRAQGTTAIIEETSMDNVDQTIIEIYRHYLKFQHVVHPSHFRYFPPSPSTTLLRTPPPLNHWLLLTRVAIEDKMKYVQKSLRGIEQKLGSKDIYLLRDFVGELFQLGKRSRPDPTQIIDYATGTSSPIMSWEMERGISDDGLSVIDLLVDLPSSQSSSTPSTVDMLESRSSPMDERPSPMTACTACEFEALFFMLHETGGLVDLHPPPVPNRSLFRLVLAWLRALALGLLAKLCLGPVALSSPDLSEWGSPAAASAVATPPASGTRKVNFNRFVLAHMCTPQPRNPGNY